MTTYPELYSFASNPEQAESLFKAGARIVQYRNKSANQSQQLLEAADIVTTSRKFTNSIVIINDSLELALASGAHGLHLGQDDGDAAEICKKHSDDLIIGVSVDTADEAVSAEKNGAAYIGAGAVYPSSTKPEAPHIGLSTLKEICAATALPVSAIGGIRLERLHDVLTCGAKMVCVISDIHNDSHPAARVHAYLQALETFKTGEHSK